MMVVFFLGGVGGAVDEEESLLVEERKVREATKGGITLALIQRPRGRKAKARKGRDRTDMASAGQGAGRYRATENTSSGRSLCLPASRLWASHGGALAIDGGASRRAEELAGGAMTRVPISTAMGSTWDVEPKKHAEAHARSKLWASHLGHDAHAAWLRDLRGTAVNAP